MSKRFIILISLLIIPLVFVIWYFLFPYFLWEKEITSFFVFTPDYFHSVIAGKGGVPAIIGNYLLQFYRWPFFGALIQALFPTLVLYSFMHILHRLPVKKVWLFLAWIPALILAWHQFYEEFITDSVRYTLIAIALALFVEILYRLFKWRTSDDIVEKNNKSSKKLIYYIIPSMFVICFFLFAFTNKDLKSHERDYKMEFLASTGHWSDLLDLIGDHDDNKMKDLCYVTLALSNMNMLGNRIFNYPVNSEEFFLFQGDASLHGTFFNQLFFQHIGIYNQAIHQAFQEATKSKYGMNFRVIMNLIKFNIAEGNADMANKYMEILSHASCYGDWIARQRVELERSLKKERVADKETVYMTSMTLNNLYNFVQAGNMNIPLNHYYLCSLLIRKNLLAFTNHLKKNLYLLQNGIPQHYQEALILADALGMGLKGLEFPELLVRQFNEFQSFIGEKNRAMINAKYKHTYWYNYYFMTFPQDPYQPTNMVSH